MDNTDYVSIFCAELAKADKGLREMHSFYLFTDKRSGSVIDRVNKDADEYVALQKLFKP